MPRECLVCGRPLLRHEHHLCIWCLTDLPQTWFWSMPRNRMADRLNALIQRDLTHPDLDKPGLAQPDLAQRSLLQPGLAHLNLAQRDSAQPSLAQLDLASTPAPSSPTTASPAAIPPAALPTLSASSPASASPTQSALTLTAAPGSIAPSPSSTSAAPTPTIPPADVLTPASSASTTTLPARSAPTTAQGSTAPSPSSTSAAPTPTTSSAGSEAPPAQGGFEPYSYAAALFFYDVNANYRRITQALKYQGDLAAGRYFARMLGERLAGSALFADVDVVIPVPLHPLRRWRRGYNQAEVIARVVAECLGVPCETGLLVRRRRTRTQTRLSVEEKAANVRTAFALRLPATHPATTAIPPAPSSAGSVAKTENAQIRSSRGTAVTPEDQIRPNPVFESTPALAPSAPPGRTQPNPGAPAPSAIPAPSPSVAPYRHILLIDDVFTTGATLNACRRTLRTAFPHPTRISVATLGYVGSA